MNYAEICLKFPCLTETGGNGLQFVEGTAASLKTHFSNNDVHVPVTWYETMGEYRDAISKGSMKYATVDPMCVAGEVTGFDPVAAMITMRVKERYASDMSSVGKVIPRCFVTKTQTGDAIEMELRRLICIDVVKQ